LPGRLIAGWVQWATGLGFRKINWQAAEAAGSIAWPVLPASGYTCPSLWRVAAAQHQATRGEQAQRGPMGILKPSHFLRLAKNRATFLLSSPPTAAFYFLPLEPSCVGGLHPRQRRGKSMADKTKLWASRHQGRGRDSGLSACPDTRHPTPDDTRTIPEACGSCTAVSRCCRNGTQ
jgi:hypothetical protein